MKLVHLFGLITMKFVMMHGHMNVQKNPMASVYSTHNITGRPAPYPHLQSEMCFSVINVQQHIVEGKYFMTIFRFLAKLAWF